MSKEFISRERTNIHEHSRPPHVCLPRNQCAGEVDQISFTVLEESGATTLRHYFSGHVSGNVIDGSVKSGGGPAAKWTAARKAG